MLDDLDIYLTVVCDHFLVPLAFQKDALEVDYPTADEQCGILQLRTRSEL